jgi:hypothetical protein
LRQVILFRHKSGPDLPDDDEHAVGGGVDTDAHANGDAEEAQAGDLTGENRTEPGATQVAASTDDNPANPAPPAAAAPPEPSPAMAGPSGERGTPPAERESTVEPPQPEVRIANPTGENRTEPGATQVAASADDQTADEPPPPVSEGLRSFAAKLGLDPAEFAAGWYGRREPSVPRREEMSP